MARHRSEPALPADDDILGELAADHITKLKSSGRKSDRQSAERSAGKKPADRHAYPSDAARPHKRKEPHEQGTPHDSKPDDTPPAKEPETPPEPIDAAETSASTKAAESSEEIAQTAEPQKADAEGDYVRDDAPVRETATTVTQEAESADQQAEALETTGPAATIETPAAETTQDIAVDAAIEEDVVETAETEETEERQPVAEAAPPAADEQPPADADSDEPVAADEPKSDVAFYDELMRSDQPAPPVRTEDAADEQPVVQTRIRQVDDEPQDAEPLQAASGGEGIESRIMNPPPLPVGTTETTDESDETDETDEGDEASPIGPISSVDAAGEADDPPPRPIPTEPDAALGSRAKHLDSGSYSVRIIGESPDIYGDGDVLIGAEPTKDISIGAEEVAFTVRIGPDEESPDWPDQSSSPLNQLAMEDIGDDATDGDGEDGNDDKEDVAATQAAPPAPPAKEPAPKQPTAEAKSPPQETTPPPAAPPKEAVAETPQGTPGLPDKEDHASSVAERIADMISELAQTRQPSATDDQPEPESAETSAEPAKTQTPPAPPAEAPPATRDQDNKAEPAIRDDQADEELGSAMNNLSRAGNAEDADEDDDEEVVLEGMPAPPPPDEDDDGSPIGEAVDARNYASSDIVSMATLGKNKSRRINARTKKNRSRGKRSADRPKDKGVAEELLDNQMAAEADEPSDGKAGKTRNGRRKSGSRQMTKRETLPAARGSDTSRKLARPTVLISPQQQNETPRWRNLGIQAGIVLLAIMATVLLMWLFVLS